MPLKHLLLILLVIFAWGFSYVATKLGLEGLPPLLFAALRFSTLLIPALFIPFPKTRLSGLILYSFFMCFSQFTLLFMAVRYGMPAGLASLVMQSQAFFTIIMGALFLQEYIKPKALIGLGIAVLGLIVIGSDTQTNVTLLGLGLTLLSALSWAVGNILIKKLQPVNTLGLTVWGTIASIIPLFIASFIFEGFDTIKTSIMHMNMTTFLAIIYLGFVATLFAYSMWAKMLSRYPASLISPFSLLVPIIGLSSTAFFLKEHLTIHEVIGSIIIMLGLCINIFGQRVMLLIKNLKLKWRL